MSMYDDQLSPLDAATSQRLAQLGQRPVDTRALEQRLNQVMALPDEASPPMSLQRYRRRWLSAAVTGLAASLAIVVGIFFMTHTAGQADAAVIELSQLHRDIVAGRIDMTPVTSAEQANEVIARQAATGPRLPSHLAAGRVQSCCLADVQGKLVAVALLKVDGKMITLVIAQAPHFAHEMGQPIEINGRRFFGHALNGVNMMMAQTDDRWLCVMGDAEPNQLAHIAAATKF